jgi:hypothetical protein
MFSGKHLVRKSSSESNAPIAVKSSSTVIVVLSYKGVECVMWKWWGVHNATMCITRADKMSITRTDKVSIIQKKFDPHFETQVLQSCCEVDMVPPAACGK